MSLVGVIVRGLAVVRIVGGEKGVGGVSRYRSYNATVTELQRLASLRPDLAKLWSTQEAYGLPTAGECRESSGQKVPCKNYILETTNRPRRAANPARPF